MPNLAERLSHYDGPARSKSWRGVGAALAGALGAAAVGNLLLGRRAERRHPPQGRFVEVDGVKLHYLERGAGPTIVLVHGNMVSASDFEISGLLDLLAGEHRVIAFDRPGFGYSERPRDRVWTSRAQGEAIWRAMERLGVERPVVLGHSLGALVALNMAADHPEDVAGAVLISGYYHPTPRPDILIAGVAGTPLLGDLLTHTISPASGRLTLPLVVRAMFAPAAVTERFRRGYVPSLMVRPSSLYAAGADALNMAPDAAKARGRGPLRAPLLVVSGRDDRIVSSRHQSERLARETPGAELHVIDGAGHMVHHTATEEVFQVVEAFAKFSAFAKELYA